MSPSKVFCLLACFFLTGCAANRINHPPAPLHQQSIVKQFQLNENESRVHFFLGDIFMFGRKIKMNKIAEFYVNNVKVGTIGNDKEYLAVDLVPGTYDFKWMPTGLDSGYTQSESLQLTIEKGMLIFVKAIMRDVSPASAKIFGAIGAITGSKFIAHLQQDANLINNMNEVTLVTLNEDIKKTLSIKKIEPDQTLLGKAPQTNLEKKLAELKILNEKGLITKEEYDGKRKELIEKY